MEMDPDAQLVEDLRLGLAGVADQLESVRGHARVELEFMRRYPAEPDAFIVFAHVGDPDSFEASHSGNDLAVMLVEVLKDVTAHLTGGYSEPHGR